MTDCDDQRPGERAGMKGLGYLLNDVARLLKRDFEREARAYSLTLPQLKVLSRLAEGDGMSQAALSALVDVSPMTLSEMLERMEANGLLRREPDPADSRAKLVRITPEAFAMLDRLRALAHGIYDRALTGIDSADQATLVRILRRMNKNLSGSAPGNEDTPG